MYRYSEHESVISYGLRQKLVDSVIISAPACFLAVSTSDASRQRLVSYPEKIRLYPLILQTFLHDAKRHMSTAFFVRAPVHKQYSHNMLLSPI